MNGVEFGSAEHLRWLREHDTWVEPFTPDGFVIVDLDTNEPFDFIACTYWDRMRDKVERGLLMRVDLDRFYVVDQRP